MSDQNALRCSQKGHGHDHRDKPQGARGDPYNYYTGFTDP